MVIVASIYLRFCIEVGVGVGTFFTDSDSSQNSFRLHGSESRALASLQGD
jgi:hypothetical protein